jgi:hypothetical protein
MTASDHLSPMFHGTPMPTFEPGETLEPYSPNFDISSGHHVYMTTDPTVARAYGTQVARKRNAAEGHDFWKGEVYEVKPEGNAEWDENEAIDFPETKTDESKRKWFKAPKATVVGYRPELSQE